MLNISNAKVYLYRKEVDGRSGINRLSGCVMAAGLNPCANAVYIFSNKSHRLLKAIFYDGVSWFLIIRRLNKGHHCWKLVGENEVIGIDQDEMDRLLKGLPVQNVCAFEEDFPPDTFPSEEEDSSEEDSSEDDSSDNDPSQ